MTSVPGVMAEGMPTVPATRRSGAEGGAPSVFRMWLIFAGVLLGTLLVMLPGVADFQKFGFFDEGAWLRLDGIVAGGATPTVDVGYSYGMVPLLLGRAWFTVFGRTPWAFIGFVTACNLLAAWGMARILWETGATRGRVAAACILLSIAIMSNNYSLMHPLEMMLIISALAQQARGRYGRALALAAVAALTKPSMAYVLGFLLLVMAAWVGRGGLKNLWRVVILPAAVGAAAFGATVWAVGWRPATANILPLKAARAYELMDFGIFRAGREFWLHGGDWKEVARHYLFEPASFWIGATLVLWYLGLMALARMARGQTRGHLRPSDPLVAMLALLHTAFVFEFYGWAGSWTYYSYLPVLGVLVGLRSARQMRVLRVLVVLGGLGLMSRYADGINRWFGMERTPESGGLWVYKDVLEEAKQARALAAENHGLFLVNGELPAIWPEARTPAVWFLSPGVLLDGEVRQVKAQMAQAGVIVLYVQYDPKQEAWKWPELAEERALFEDQPVWEGRIFRVFKKRGG